MDERRIASLEQELKLIDNWETLFSAIDPNPDSKEARQRRRRDIIRELKALRYPDAQGKDESGNA